MAYLWCTPLLTNHFVCVYSRDGIYLGGHSSHSGLAAGVRHAPVGLRGGHEHNSVPFEDSDPAAHFLRHAKGPAHSPAVHQGRQRTHDGDELVNWNSSQLQSFRHLTGRVKNVHVVPVAPLPGSDLERIMLEQYTHTNADASPSHNTGSTVRTRAQPHTQAADGGGAVARTWQSRATAHCSQAPSSAQRRKQLPVRVAPVPRAL